MRVVKLGHARAVVVVQDALPQSLPLEACLRLLEQVVVRVGLAGLMLRELDDECAASRPARVRLRHHQPLISGATASRERYAASARHSIPASMNVVSSTWPWLIPARCRIRATAKNTTLATAKASGHLPLQSAHQ